MKKTAIFVEGGTELIVIRDYLVLLFEGDLHLQCYSLLGGQLQSAEYDILNEVSENHFMLINAGSDTLVLPSILRREQYFINKDYYQIIGLRDMYSENYRFLNNPSRKVNQELNERFIDETQKTILEKAIQPDKIKFCFSIMEIETWFLGLYEVFEKIDSQLTIDFINKKLGVNLAEIDPEKEIFHPATFIKKIYKLVDKDYGKRTSDVNKITGQISKQDYITLLERNKCASFNNFHNAIFAE